MAYEMLYPHLFEPLQIGKTRFRNRIFVAPTGIICPKNKDEYINYYEEKARGGAAVVTVGQGYVDNEHGSDIRGAGFDMADSKVGPEIAPIADAIRKHGAIASLELFHASMNSFQSGSLGNTVYGPVAMVIESTHSDAGAIAQVEEMPEEMILKTIQMYADAAYKAKRAGFGMCLLHGGHGWLLHQFFSPKLNTRTDKWGGESLENRARLAIEICKAIHEACGPDFLIEFRMSVRELGDGYETDTGLEIAKIMDDYVDMIHASCGNHEGGEAFVIMHPSTFLEDGCNRNYAKLLKEAGIKSPIVTVGAFSDPGFMDQVIAEGGADVIAVARGILADPYLPAKAYAGKPDEINQCLRCHACYAGLMFTDHYYCAINPRIGHELEHRLAPVACKHEKVMIAGGGIAGMQAALEAANRGHEVILVEKSDRLGGVLLCEDDVPFKAKQTRYLYQQARRCMENESIEVRLNTAATKKLAAEIAPDAIICAVGSKASPVTLKGADNAKVVDPVEAYKDPSLVGDTVVLIGGGFVAMELAIYLTLKGRKCTVVIRKDTPKIMTDNNVHGEAVLAQFGHLDIKMCTGTSIVEINDQGVLGKNAEGEVLFECDTVIPALGREPLYDVIDELRLCAPEFYIVGDANCVKDIMQANTQGYYCARDIGTMV